MKEFDGRTAVISQILKLEGKEFTAATIHFHTSMSRNLIYYHLTQLVKDGYLEKHGKDYLVINKEGLIEALTYSAAKLSENSIALLTKQLPFFTNIEKMNERAKVAVALKNGCQDNNVREWYIEQVDEAITELKKFKRYLRNKEMSKVRAFQILRPNPSNDEFERDFYSAFKDVLDMSLDDFLNMIYKLEQEIAAAQSA